jgi:UDP-N-acetylglucosamine 2-epimerase
MPEEINRLVTDQLADMLFTPSEDGNINLQKEGIPAERIFRVGNVMIDSLVTLLPAAQRPNRNRLPERYALVTLHRPANVDDGVILKRILQSLLEVSQDLSLPDAPREHRAPNYGFPGNQRSRRTRSGKTAFRILPSPLTQRREPFLLLGRSRGRTNRRFAGWLGDLLSYS